MEKSGLTTAEVQRQIEEGNVNYIKEQASKTTKEIVLENLLTYFNAIFLGLAVLLIIAGSYRSLTFLPVIVANTVIGIYQQLKAKKILDDLSLLDKSEYQVVRNGKHEARYSDELVLGDLVYLEAGKQIPADGYVEDGFSLVNESLLTGEADEVEKDCGAPLMSGSFVVSGCCYMTITGVGEDSYAAKLMHKAKEVSDKKSEMICDIETIIKLAGILIIPIGMILYIQGMMGGESFRGAIESMVGAVIGMIPEGMYLLVTVALALSASHLAKRQVLLHDMRSIETLARVNVLCVDKTGTITNADMSVMEVFSPEDVSKEELRHNTILLSEYVQTIKDTNITMQAMRKYFIGSEKMQAVFMEPFSSKTKYSVIKTEDEEYRLGAPEVLLDESSRRKNDELIVKRTRKGQRVLAFIRQKEEGVEPLLFVSLENEVRENAEEMFNYFAEQGVEVKVISGDNPQTVSAVAKKAGIKNAEHFVDATTLFDEEMIESAVSEYTVFGRVKPEQKKQIVVALQTKGQKVAMTGDGVNDILAMKEADCSIAMGNGSDAARESAQVVLMDSDFAHLKEIVQEGRKDINNITRSATLFLYKNMFSLFMALFSIVNFFSYPIEPSQVSMISMFNIGIPSFLLALEQNEKRQEGRFIKKTLLNAMPAAVTSFLAIAALVYFAELFELPNTDIGTASTYLLSVVGFIILYQLCVPQNGYRLGVFAVSIVGFLLSDHFLDRLFAMEDLSVRCIVLCTLFALAEVTVMRWLTSVLKEVKKEKQTQDAAAS